MIVGARGAQPLGCDLDVAVCARGAADEVGQHGVAVAFPPGDLGLVRRGRSLGELAGDFDLGLDKGGRAGAESECDQRDKGDLGDASHGIGYAIIWN